MATICRDFLEHQICNYLGLTPAKGGNDTVDAYKDEKTFQIKCLLGNPASISTKFVVAGDSIDDVVSRYMTNFDFLIIYDETNRNKPFNPERLKVYNKITATKWLARHCDWGEDRCGMPTLRIYKKERR